MTGLVLVDGFNVLPYRMKKRREARSRRLTALAAAALAGCAAVGAAAGWDALDRARLDERRLALEASLRASGAKVAEHGRLTEAEAQRRRARDTAAPLAAPAARFLALLDALAEAQQGGVALQRVSQQTNAVELAAFASDSQAAARWLKLLEAVRGVEAVEVVEMKRPVPAPLRAKAAQAPAIASGYEFTALVRWTVETPAAQSKKALVASAKGRSK
ncbi:MULTISPECIES: PilN domain-containing protein [unclassified Caballeronia]|uniref:PilN domain-containing protein n=1 Tax=unclassified Caballeronia TaxID=2646786 RepID=UPI00285D6EF3|nr:MULTISPECIES: PilN domain-containing protein [unclassified Caballeronia]MDR5751837.1 PilN domain-containing protein [Caballeronia sp. LZ024]MDR5844023.1 PilN domain-containing protein [Caballeronia sp. LZ031]